jgi:hypothetical protein
MAGMFQQAVKRASKGRAALIGPAGSGKSYTMLKLAQALARGGKIAAVDTEHGSLSKYADQFGFDVVELTSFAPQHFLEALREAAAGGYAVFCCDSLSHFWIGKDGALEFVDASARRQRDKMAGWKEFRPHERAMVDAMLAAPLHVLCTMRTKTDYQEVIDAETGKKKRVKIGLAPVQRDGLEYEFDLVGYMEDATLVVDKTRCSSLAGKAITKPDVADFAVFVDWLEPRSERQREMTAGATADNVRAVLKELGRSEGAAIAHVFPGTLKTLATLTPAELSKLHAALLSYQRPTRV